MADQGIGLDSLLGMADQADQEQALQPPTSPEAPTAGVPAATPSAPQMAIGSAPPADPSQLGLPSLQDLLQQAKPDPQQLEMERMLREELLKTPDIRAREKYADLIKEKLGIDINKPDSSGLSRWMKGATLGLYEYNQQRQAARDQTKYQSLHDQALAEALAEYKEVAPQATRVEAQLSAEKRAQLAAAIAVTKTQEANALKQQSIDNANAYHMGINAARNRNIDVIEQLNREGRIPKAQADILLDIARSGAAERQGYTPQINDAKEMIRRANPDLEKTDPTEFNNQAMAINAQLEAAKLKGKYSPGTAPTPNRVESGNYFDPVTKERIITEYGLGKGGQPGAGVVNRFTSRGPLPSEVREVSQKELDDITALENTSDLTRKTIQMVAANPNAARPDNILNANVKGLLGLRRQGNDMDTALQTATGMDRLAVARSLSPGRTPQFIFNAVKDIDPASWDNAKDIMNGETVWNAINDGRRWRQALQAGVNDLDYFTPMQEEINKITKLAAGRGNNPALSKYTPPTDIEMLSRAASAAGKVLVYRPGTKIPLKLVDKKDVNINGLQRLE